MRSVIPMLLILMLVGCGSEQEVVLDPVEQLEKELFPAPPPDEDKWELETFFWAAEKHLPHSDNDGWFESGWVYDQRNRMVCYKVIDKTDDDNRTVVFELEEVEGSDAEDPTSIAKFDGTADGWQYTWGGTSYFQVKWNNCRWGVAVYRLKDGNGDPNLVWQKGRHTDENEQDSE